MNKNTSTSQNLLPKLTILLFLCNFSLQAQMVTKQKTVTRTSAPIVTANSTVIQVDMAMRTFSDILPFDVPFVIAGSGGGKEKLKIDQLIGIECYYATKKDSKIFPDAAEVAKYKDTKDAYRYAFWENNGSDTQFRLSIGELEPNEQFSFFFKFRRKLAEDEKLRLVNYASSIIRPLIQQKAKGGTFAFSDPDIDNMINDILKLLSNDLTSRGLSIENPAISKTNHETIAKVIEEVGFAMESSNDELESLGFNINALGINQSTLTQFLDQYKMNGDADKKEENLGAIQTALGLFKPIYSFPRDDNAARPEVVKAYLAQLDALKAELAKVNLPAASPFQAIRAEIIDHIGDLSVNFGEYALSLKNTGSVTAAQVSNLVAAVATSIYDEIIIGGTSVNGNFVTRSNSYITADLGVALLPSIGKMIPYLGTNIYLRPINQNRPLKMSEFGADFSRRFSFMLGLTYSTLTKTNYREDLMSTFNLITGAGLRIADFVKVNGGVVWFTKVNPNPLNTNNSVGSAGFVSLSFDLQIKTVFHKLFTATQIQP